MTNELKILLAIGVVTLALFGGAIWWMVGQNPDNHPVDITLLQRPESHRLGTASAQVTLVEFGDYQCPSCAAVHPGVKSLLAQYPDQLQFVFRHYPLNMHPNAQISAEAAEAAGAQGKYWEMHAWLYEHQTEWANSKNPIDLFADAAKSLNLNVDEFKKALNDHTFRKVIQQDLADGNALRVEGTPTFYLNGKKVTGSLSDLQKHINEAIQSNK